MIDSYSFFVCGGSLSLFSSLSQKIPGTLGGSIEVVDMALVSGTKHAFEDAAQSTFLNLIFPKLD